MHAEAMGHENKEGNRVAYHGDRNEQSHPVPFKGPGQQDKLWLTKLELWRRHFVDQLFLQREKGYGNSIST
jgi:hypothetical protein